MRAEFAAARSLTLTLTLRGSDQTGPVSGLPRGLPFARDTRLRLASRVWPERGMPEQEALSRIELIEAWPLLSDEDRVQGFSLLSRGEAEELFHSLEARDQGALLMALSVPETRLWLRTLAPDDAVDVIQTC